MSITDEMLAGQKIVASVRGAFPEDAARIDAILRDNCFDVEESPHIWLEHFSQFTTNAIKVSQFDVAKAHLGLISSLLEGADEPSIRCIDVAYVESLLWDIRDARLKHEGWLLIPHNLKSLYIAMWGMGPFMQGAE